MRRNTEIGEAVLTVDHYQGLFVSRKLGAGVVVADKGHAFCVATAHIGLVNLRFAATVGGEIDGGTIFTPERFCINCRVVGNTSQATRSQIHDIDLGITVLGQYERQLGAIRRPRRCTVQTFKVGDLLATTSINVLHKNTRTFLFERYISDTLAIGCKTRRQDRLTGLQQGHGASTVVVRALQGVTGVGGAGALSRHIQQTG